MESFKTTAVIIYGAPLCPGSAPNTETIDMGLLLLHFTDEEPEAKRGSDLIIQAELKPGVM